jgi:hypothetical protein
MDDDRFDLVARSLANVSRRTALGGALSAGLAAAGARLAVTDARAKKCKRKKKLCKGTCISKKHCCQKADCPDKTFCKKGDCVCAGTEVACSKPCVHGACTCKKDGDCPEGCSCGSRAQGGSACASGVSINQPCNIDDHCPQGSFCAQTILACSIPCET